MPRKRMIHPDLWADEEVGRLSRDARLLWIAMFSLADDEGRGNASIPYLRRAVFGFDDDMTTDRVLTLRQEIASAIRGVQFYVSDGRELYALANWARFQKVQHPSPSVLPAPTTAIIDSTASTKDGSDTTKECTASTKPLLDKISIDKISIDIATPNGVDYKENLLSAEEPEKPKPTKPPRVKAGDSALYHWEKTKCRISDMQIEEINKTATDLPKWKTVVDEWLLHGFSPKNIAGPLEWYKKGLPTFGKPPPGRRAAGEAHYDETELARLRAVPAGPKVALPADLF